MLELEGINYIAVVVVWFIYMFIGAFWYSPAGFAKQWTKHTGIDIMKIPTQRANQIIGYVALSALIQAFSLAVIINSLHVVKLENGLAVGLLLWLGFTAATTVGTTLYSKRGWGFLWLNSSYFLVVILIGSLLFSVWT